MRYILLDGRRFTSKEGSYRYLQKKLKCPLCQGHNLDALHDELTSMPPCRIHIRRPQALRKALGSYGARMLAVFADATHENPGLKVYK